ncbi:MAG: hypothetical protein AB7O59_12465 [Pirellulales bacterium]
MKFKASVAWLMIAVFCLAPVLGCKPVDTKAPDEPAPNTTDSK